MPPSDRPIPRFVAEPPREAAPYGRFGDVLEEHFLAACARIEADEEIGDPGAVSWFPDRTLAGRTYVPVTAPSPEGYELFGYVSFTREHDGAEAVDFEAVADYTDETAEANPGWALDLSDQELLPWRGRGERRGMLALVWGVALVQGGAVATAELGPDTLDQCELAGDRFTLVSLDSDGGDFLEVRLWDSGGGELAGESLYEE